jgi:hypothetical protein
MSQIKLALDRIIAENPDCSEKEVADLLRIEIENDDVLAQEAVAETVRDLMAFEPDRAIDWAENGLPTTAEFSTVLEAMRRKKQH